ncbi:hypothetical protein N7488_005939 [Penicillium malachiteum]|nr:hypothetical protein N7488_005939 [Penicillium malachiteum]
MVIGELYVLPNPDNNVDKDKKDDEKEEEEKEEEEEEEDNNNNNNNNSDGRFYMEDRVDPGRDV